MRIKIESLVKRYHHQQVISKLFLDLKEVRSLAVVGASGSGKSTLLRILAGLESPEEGSIELNGVSLNFNEKFLKTYRKSIGVVFQSYNLFPHLSVLENIVLPLEKTRKTSKKEALEKAMTLFQRFHLTDHAHKKPAQLSGGQKQRVAICRALALDAKLLLLDEPTSALDPVFTSEVLDMIFELKEENRDFILVTHEMGFARKAADYLIFLHEGRIWEQGIPETLFQAPKTQEWKDFLGKVLKY